MHPSTAQARVIVDELIRCGVRHIVACPGSRNAPLSMAAHDAALAGRVTLHVRIDERSAAFLAMGIGKSGAGPAAVCCTSGTAAANFHPATLEARHSGTPLILLTADRPAELRRFGANQTIDQRDLYGPAAPHVELPLADQRPAANAVWRATVCRAVSLAGSGPVQLNVPLREPLVSTDDTSWPHPLAGRTDGGPWTRWPVPAPGESVADGLSARTVLVVGDPVGAPSVITAASRAAAAAGWPVVAEPTGFAAALAGGGTVLDHGSLLVNAGPLAERLRPVDVVVAGRPTLSRGVTAVLRSARRLVVLGGWTDPLHAAAEIAYEVAPATPDPTWLTAWTEADAAVRTIANGPLPEGPAAARDVVAALPEDATLFLGSSNPVRYVDFFGPPGTRTVVANRGVAGIDGSVATAAGIALGSGRPCYALLGDLTFLHDLNGLLIGPAEQRPDLTVVVLNDDGGGIFTLLEQGAPEHAASFDRVFGTPHHADLAALCAGYGVPHALVSDPDKLLAALAPAPGPRVIEVRADRSGLRDWQATLFAATRSVLG